MLPPKILVVDDEPTIRTILVSYLEREGYDVFSAADGDLAVAAVAEHRPDLILLDVLLPGYDGLTVMARVRRDYATPIILLTARGEESDRIAGLRLGADDYVVKPFSPAEVVARVGAVLRRREAATPGEHEILAFGAVVVDCARRTVTVSGRSTELTAREFDLLQFLARQPERAFSRDEIMRAVWRSGFYDDTSTVTVHIRRLRQKLERDPLTPRHLVTVWGVGYRLDR